MTEDRPSELLGALPRSRPHRRSDKRPARAGVGPEAEGQETNGQETGDAPKKTAAPRRSASAVSPGAKPRPRRTHAKSTRASAKSPQSKAKAAPLSKAKAAPLTKAKSGSANAKLSAPARRRGRLPQPAQPRGVPRGTRGPRPEPRTDFPVLRTAIQAAAELTEIGVTLSAKALRGAISRLPRP
jgi:hypothetical protein